MRCPEEDQIVTQRCWVEGQASKFWELQVWDGGSKKPRVETSRERVSKAVDHGREHGLEGALKRVSCEETCDDRSQEEEQEPECHCFISSLSLPVSGPGNQTFISPLCLLGQLGTLLWVGDNETLIISCSLSRTHASILGSPDSWPCSREPHSATLLSPSYLASFSATSPPSV